MECAVPGVRTETHTHIHTRSRALANGRMLTHVQALRTAAEKLTEAAAPWACRAPEEDEGEVPLAGMGLPGLGAPHTVFVFDLCCFSAVPTALTPVPRARAWLVPILRPSPLPLLPCVREPLCRHRACYAVKV